LLGVGWVSASLVASLAEPVALVLGAVAGVTFFVNSVRNGYLESYFSSEEGEMLGSGLIGASVFYLVFVGSQAAIVILSPLAGILVMALVVAVFFMGPGLLFDLVEVVLDEF